jgi:hypothetical protein
MIPTDIYHSTAPENILLNSTMYFSNILHINSLIYFLTLVSRGATCGLVALNFETPNQVAFEPSLDQCGVELSIGVGFDDCIGETLYYADLVYIDSSGIPRTSPSIDTITYFSDVLTATLSFSAEYASMQFGSPITVTFYYSADGLLQSLTIPWSIESSTSISIITATAMVSITVNARTSKSVIHKYLRSNGENHEK